MALTDDLLPGPVAIDTAIFIYYMEEDATFLPLVDSLFHAIDSQKLTAVTSAITLLETLVVPYRIGDHALAEQYETLLTRSRGLRLIDLDGPVLRAAAYLRANTPIETPDALQAAAALKTGCTSFLTNDRELPPIGRLRIVQLRDYL